MGEVRAFSPHVRWSVDEVAVLRDHYAAAPLADLELLLPGRSRRTIQCQANGLGLTRQRAPKRTPAQALEAKRRQMAERRAADPEAARAYHRARHHGNHEANKAAMREYVRRRFFWTKAMKLRGEGRATARDLAALWKAQRGLCALTGRRLDRAAQLDHKLAKARGGARSHRQPSMALRGSEPCEAGAH
jgi:5-methylcytosine-specific restriction endonuclease McrA